MYVFYHRSTDLEANLMGMLHRDNLSRLVCCYVAWGVGSKGACLLSMESLQAQLRSRYEHVRVTPDQLQTTACCACAVSGLSLIRSLNPAETWQLQGSADLADTRHCRRQISPDLDVEKPRHPRSIRPETRFEPGSFGLALTGMHSSCQQTT